MDLIKKDKAYVCFQSAEEMKAGREAKTDSPWRNKTVAENLKNFEKMRQGRYAEGECSLRVKMDMQHPNPCMRDFVAYRIRYVSHPHSGDKWCIYPTYDFTHCLVDSIENVTHSLCTLEFEIRRESYYQLLKDAGMYKPFVWEFGRLNMSNTVLSKRKIEKLVDIGKVSGWDDPRLHTIQGLRKRGYTPSMINTFCEAVGVARHGNETLTSYKKLEVYARRELEDTAPRTFAVLDPLKIEITNFNEIKNRKIEVPLFPGKENTKKQTYDLTKTVYVERSDFCKEKTAGHRGIQPGQNVLLLHGPVILLEDVVTDNSGEVTCVKVKAITDYEGKPPQGKIHWVSAENSIQCKVNEYDRLFTVEDVVKTSKAEGKDFLDYFNEKSLVVRPNARIWKSLASVKPYDRFQFVRTGYFCVEHDSKPGNIVFNAIVALKEGK